MTVKNDYRVYKDGGSYGGERTNEKRGTLRASQGVSERPPTTVLDFVGRDVKYCVVDRQTRQFLQKRCIKEGASHATLIEVEYS